MSVVDLRLPLGRRLGLAQKPEMRPAFDQPNIHFWIRVRVSPTP